MGTDFCNKKLPKPPESQILAEMDPFFLLVCISPAILSLIFHGFYVHSRIGVKDVPNERSLHTEVTKKSGGMIFLPLFLVFLLGIAYLGENGRFGFEAHTANLRYLLPYLLSGVLAFGCIGFLDDLYSLSPKIRLFLEAGFLGFWTFFLSPNLSLFEIQIPYLWVAVVLLTFLGVFMINLVNFMDGLDLYLIGTVFYSSLFWWTIYSGQFAFGGTLFFVTVCLFQAAAGFVYYNFPKAKLFMGDSGSLGLGFLLISLPVLGTKPETTNFELASFFYLFPIFWIDGIITILIRSYEKKHIFQAHREHLYQYLTETKLGKKWTCFWMTLANLPAGICYFYFIDLPGKSTFLSKNQLLILLILGYTVVYIVLRIVVTARRKNLA
ncbi:sugar phosphotransferase [Leptospira idonii]|uniref:Sugar phosphotransferase n=2 Tax=Leptospira idonii TaxID=1193500 RepID=A0A4R9LZI9_9LEPT|nr:sugar phosphotransferase [Leptospira idonii]